MTQLSFTVLAILGGLLAGGVFFGGLWWTVQRINRSRRPIMLVLGSLVIRSALTLLVFYLIMAITGQLLYLVVALVLFILVRMVMSRQVKGTRYATES